MSAQILFLPGAMGRTALWQPVASLLAYPGRKAHVGWPGFGTTPPDPSVRGIDDLVRMVATRVNGPTAIVAQSMGGAVAVRVALAKPKLVTHLILAATSGGIDVGALGGEDWRPGFLATNPSSPRWFVEDQEDLSSRLANVSAPALLIWGDADPISPLRVGERLACLLPRAQLHVVRGGNHDLAETHARELAPLIDDFLIEKPASH